MAKQQSMKSASPVTLEAPSLDPGIHFADDEGAPVPTQAPSSVGGSLAGMSAVAQEAPLSTSSSGHLADVLDLRTRNQDAAKRAIAGLKGLDMQKSFPQMVRPDLPPMSAEEERSRQAPRYRVLVDREVARGGGKCRLPAGKVISANGYDIAELRRQGVQLEEVPPQ